MIRFFFFGFVAFNLSLLAVWFTRNLSRKQGWVASPRADRWHSTPTALYGGVGIFFSFSITNLFIYFFYKPIIHYSFFLVLFLGGSGSFLLGFIDDLYHLKPVSKLVGEIALSTLFIIMGGTFEISSSNTINILLTYFWFIGIINAINFLDNMDGLASGVSIISSLSLLSLMVINGSKLATDPMLLIIFIFIMSILGFLVFNFSPASIFMGDMGSLFLGYTLAALTIPHSFNHYGDQANYSSLLSLFLPVVILGIPIFDTTLVTVSRIFSGRGVTRGGCDHSSHRLVGLGFSEKLSVLILYILTSIGGLTAILMTLFHETSLLLFGIYIVFLIIIGIYLGKKKITSYNEAPKNNKRWTPLVGQIMYKKGMIEVALDIILISLCYFSSFLLITPTTTLKTTPNSYAVTLPIVIVSTIIVFQFSHVYRGVWHLLAIEDIYIFLKAISVSFFMLLLINLFIFHSSVPWEVYITFSLLLFFSVVGSRLSFRFFDTFVSTHGLSKRPKKILLYGAGAGGKLLVSEIKKNEKFSSWKPIGFLDDDLSKQGRTVSGVKILGDLLWLSKGKYNPKNINFSEIWITFKKIPAGRIEELRKILNSDLPIKKISLDIIAIETTSFQNTEELEDYEPSEGWAG